MNTWGFKPRRSKQLDPISFTKLFLWWQQDRRRVVNADNSPVDSNPHRMPTVRFGGLIGVIKRSVDQATALKLAESHMDKQWSQLMCLNAYVCIQLDCSDIWFLRMMILLVWLLIFSCLLAEIHNELHDRSRCTMRLDSLVNVWSLVASTFEKFNSCLCIVDADLLMYRMHFTLYKINAD